MDTEQQIRLNFLDEAEEYFDLMESHLLGLADTALNPQKVNLILRLAHSIKGGAAMMNFDKLSQVAHRIEDFLTILRDYYVAQSIDVEVETLLLQSLDRLRYLANLNRLKISAVNSDNDSEVQANLDRTQAIFDKLRLYLGELEDANKNALLIQNEDLDPAVLIFEEGIEEVLNRFEAQLPKLKNIELAQELSAVAKVLIGFGNMANLPAFVRLCESIARQAIGVSSSKITTLAKQALRTWRRAHALVLRGSVDELPSDLKSYEYVACNCTEADLKFEPQKLLSDSVREELDSFDAHKANFITLQSALKQDVPKEAAFDPLDIDAEDLSSLQSAFELDNFPKTPANSSSEGQNSSGDGVEKMVRIPVSQLKQFSTLSEQLISDRNNINLRLEQLQNVVSLMNQRLFQVKRSHAQLKQWCDRASFTGVEDEKEDLELASDHLTSERHPGFDRLERDSYIDIHFICQQQLETIVQLDRVATNIKLEVEKIQQSARELHHTTNAMQSNVTRTKMLPFADAVKRFPRVIRELNLQFNKKAELKIVGKQTLLDRCAIEAVKDPLMHLLHNAFAHGIEDPQIRSDNGKPESGTITIQAKNQDIYSLITLSDDGRGISLGKIRDRLIQMGLSQSKVAQISEDELLEMIFAPGFSTAKQVTELSGRGVGLDIVRSNIQEIGGDVRVDTELKKGTTFTIKIPHQGF